MPQFPQMQQGYSNMWNSCTVTQSADADKLADHILVYKDRYVGIEKRLGIPWPFVACIHMRESSLDFKTHLHNGDSLKDYTYNVPSGRPKNHVPPFTWDESADDALVMKGYQKVANWSLELMLFDWEAYNGWGYLNKDNSPYIWAWTNLYHGGKFTSDGHYDPNHWDKQPGCVALLKALAAKDESAKRWTLVRTGAQVPAGTTERATTKERNARNTGAAGAGAATTSEVTTPKPADGTHQFAYHMVHGAVICIGLVVALVAVVLITRKARLIQQKFMGTAATLNHLS